MTHANALPEDASDTARILALLERMDARLTRLESTVGSLAEQAPGLTAAAVDTVDSTLARLSEQGVDVDERVHNSVSALEAVTRPETTRLLQRVVERTDDIEALLDVLPQAPGLTAAAIDTVDGALAQLAARGVDVDARLRVTLALVEKLTRPDVADRLSEALAQLDALPGLIATAADTLDGVIGQVVSRGVDLDGRMRASAQALEAITRPEVAEMVSAVADNAGALTELTHTLPQLPGMAAAAADTLDGVVAQLGASGVDVDARLRGGLKVLEQLTRPEVIALAEEGIPQLLELPGLAAAAADTLDGTIGRLAANGVDIDARMQAVLSTLELVTRPEVAGKLSEAVAQADALPGLVATAADTLDGMLGQLGASGIDVDARVSATLRAAEIMTRPDTVRLVEMLMARSDELAALTQTLLESGVFAQESANLVGNTGTALVATRKEPNGALGIFGLMRSLANPDIQRAASFGVRFAERFGQMLETPIDRCLSRDAQPQSK